MSSYRNYKEKVLSNPKLKTEYDALHSEYDLIQMNMQEMKRTRGDTRSETSCYLIAKDRNKRGCIAFKTKHGKRLSELKRELNAATAGRSIQLVTISHPTAYGEYSPYVFAETEEEFVKSVKAM